MPARIPGPPKYPCFFLLNENGNPEIAEIDGKLALCVFTDQDTIDAFYKQKYGVEFETRAVKLHRFSNRSQLVGMLTEAERRLARQRCLHLAFDPVPESEAHYASIREFVKAGNLKPKNRQ